LLIVCLVTEYCVLHRISCSYSRLWRNLGPYSETMRWTYLLLGCQCHRLRVWLPSRKTTDTSTCTTLTVCVMADRQRWAR